jgi:hypothetical protein
MLEYDFQDAAGREMLALGCAALDRAEDCKMQIDRDGAVIRTKAGLKDHPLLRHEAVARAFVVKTLKALNLDVEPLRQPGRPPGRIMATKRTPIGRPPRSQITPAAIEIFRRMQAVEAACTCEPVDWGGEYWNHRTCAACEEWWDAHSALWRELRKKPWQWPCVQHPAARCPYPEGSYAANQWGPNLEAQAMWRELDAAAGQR